MRRSFLRWRKRHIRPEYRNLPPISGGSGKAEEDDEADEPTSDEDGDRAGSEQDEPGDEEDDGDPLASLTPAQQAAINRKIGQARSKARQQARKEAEKEAEEQRKKAAGEWEQLATDREAEIEKLRPELDTAMADLEQSRKEAARLNAAIAELVKPEVEALDDLVRGFVEEKDPIEQLEWLNANRDKLGSNGQRRRVAASKTGDGNEGETSADVARRIIDRRYGTKQAERSE